MDALLKDKAFLSLILMLIILVVCNFAFVYSKGWLRWGWQLFGFGSLFVVYKLAGLSLSDIGLSPDKIMTGLKYSLVAVAAIGVALLVAYFINQKLFSDTRYNQGLQAAFIASFFIVPLKTVLFEEIAFRGIIPALLKDFNPSFWFILIVSSLLFGLWHILSAPQGNSLGVGGFSNWLVVLGVLAITTAGGALLYFLRYYSDSLVAPIIVHWFINGFAIILSSLSWLNKS